MVRLCNLNELNGVSSDVAWKLVDSLFQQAKVVILGGVIFLLLGAIGFAGTGSLWYLGGAAVCVAICAARFIVGRRYVAWRDSASALIWARRSMVWACLSAACWGVWGSAVILFEPEISIVVIVVGSVSATVTNSAIRNCAVLAVAKIQIFVMLTPIFFACLASGNGYFVLFAVFLPLNGMTGLSIAKFLHHQTLQLLLRNEEKSELVARLEAARQELETINIYLEGLALVDSLTGIANRRAFDLTAARELRRSQPENTSLALLILDVDQFKSFNDIYGHQAGDVCLREVAATIGSALRRPGDLVARYGGEEFVVILPRTDLQGAAAVGESIIKAFADRNMPHASAQSSGHVSVSIGAAAMLANSETTVEDLTARADIALYAAKRGGRNRLCTADAPEQLTSPGLCSGAEFCA
jgi:diguanylate cyclase (GGDEF)-like protein